MNWPCTVLALRKLAMTHARQYNRRAGLDPQGKTPPPTPRPTLRRDLPWWHRHRTGSKPCMSGPALVACSDQLSCHPGPHSKRWDGRLYHLSHLSPVGAWSCRTIPTGSLWIEAIAAYLRGEDPVMMVNCKQEALSQTNDSLQWRFAVRIIEQKVLLCDTNATKSNEGVLEEGQRVKKFFVLFLFVWFVLILLF